MGQVVMGLAAIIFVVSMDKKIAEEVASVLVLFVVVKNYCLHEMVGNSVCKAGEICNNGKCTSSTASSSQTSVTIKPDEGGGSTGVIVGGVAAGVAVLGIAIGVFFFIQKQKRKVTTLTTQNSGQSVDGVQVSPIHINTTIQPTYYDFYNVPKDANGNPLLPFDPQTGKYVANGSLSPTTPIVPAQNSQPITPPASFGPPVDPTFVPLMPGRPDPSRNQSLPSSSARLNYQPNTQSSDRKPNATAIGMFSPTTNARITGGDEIGVYNGDPIAVNATFADGWADGINLYVVLVT
ncbi:hypothetical protein HK098_000735 [Nowakowskiella sp. JEL0407]|nr:hypothetical protein HK098_000735 [Nowakowskiella sp. JEL0407]